MQIFFLTIQLILKFVLNFSYMWKHKSGDNGFQTLLYVEIVFVKSHEGENLVKYDLITVALKSVVIKKKEKQVAFDYLKWSDDQL